MVSSLFSKRFVKAPPPLATHVTPIAERIGMAEHERRRRDWCAGFSPAKMDCAVRKLVRPRLEILLGSSRARRRQVSKRAKHTTTHPRTDPDTKTD